MLLKFKVKKQYSNGGKTPTIEDFLYNIPVKDLPTQEQYNALIQAESDRRIADKRITRRPAFGGEESDIGFPGLTSGATCTTESCDIHNEVANQLGNIPKLPKHIYSNYDLLKSIREGKTPFKVDPSPSNKDAGLMFFGIDRGRSGNPLNADHVVFRLPNQSGDKVSYHHSKGIQGVPVQQGSVLRRNQLPKSATSFEGGNRLTFTMGLPSEAYRVPKKLTRLSLFSNITN